MVRRTAEASIFDAANLRRGDGNAPSHPSTADEIRFDAANLRRGDGNNQSNLAVAIESLIGIRRRESPPRRWKREARHDHPPPVHGFDAANLRRGDGNAKPLGVRFRRSVDAAHLRRGDGNRCSPTSVPERKRLRGRRRESPPRRWKHDRQVLRAAGHIIDSRRRESPPRKWKRERLRLPAEDQCKGRRRRESPPRRWKRWKNGFSECSP